MSLAKENVTVHVYQEYREVFGVWYHALVSVISTPNGAQVYASVYREEGYKLEQIARYFSPDYLPHHRAMRVARVAERKARRIFYRACNQELNKARSGEGAAA